MTHYKGKKSRNSKMVVSCFENGLFMYNDTLYNIERINTEWIKINHIKRKIKLFEIIDIEKDTDEFVTINNRSIHSSRLVKV